MLIQTVYINTGVNRRELTSYFIVMQQSTYVIPVRIDRKPYQSFKSSKMVTKQDVPNKWKKKTIGEKILETHSSKPIFNHQQQPLEFDG